MTSSSSYEEIQKILHKTHAAQELAIILVERTQWSIESHASGAYGTAREQALTASLARQLIGAMEQLEEHRLADHHDAMEN